MAITIKTPEEQQKMREAGQAAASVLLMIEEHVRAGITTAQLNQICHDFMVNELNVVPATLGYRGFPASICTSPNHVICHGIPNDKPLKNGDILNIDVTVIKDGWHGDTSKMFVIGKIPTFVQKLINVTHEAMCLGIDQVKPGARFGEIGAAIEGYIRKTGFSIVQEYCGHGIGRIFHEEPHVMHFGKKTSGMIMQPGMCFTIEPMINAGGRDIRLLNDQWTVITKDHSLSAQWEHTILVTETGHEVLTLRNGAR